MGRFHFRPRIFPLHPAAGTRKSSPKTLSEEAGESMDEILTKAQASERIDALQRRTGSGTGDPTKH